jgi:hypothetical protein
MNLSEFKRSTASGDIEMTDTLLSPDDTGEIPQPVGETRIRIETGEKTRNLREERDAILAATGRLYSAPPTLRRSVPYVMPADRKPWAGARHAKPAPLWARAALLVGGAMVAVAVAALAVLAVVR